MNSIKSWTSLRVATYEGGAKDEKWIGGGRLETFSGGTVVADEVNFFYKFYGKCSKKLDHFTNSEKQLSIAKPSSFPEHLS